MWKVEMRTNNHTAEQVVLSGIEDKKQYQDVLEKKWLPGVGLGQDRLDVENVRD